MPYHDTKGSFHIREADCIAFGREGIGLEPGRLWSLWDMLRFYAYEFIRAMEELSAIRVAILDGAGEDELNIDDVMRHHAKTLVRDLELLGMQFTLASANRMAEAFSEPKILTVSAKQKIEDVQDRFSDEFKGVILLAINSDQAKHFEPPVPLFGTEVESVFSCASYDIAEAGKCLALDRSTACAFHLMRAVELGMRHLCTSLSVTVSPNASWQTLLNDKLEPAINKLPDSSDVERQRKRELQQARAHLHAIRLAWRNDTMHPKATYTPEESGELFKHVESFMRHLADHV